MRMKITPRLSPKVERCKREAADGDAEAQFTLGLFFEGGKMGLLQDYAESAKWYRKAAEQDHSAAQLYLGVYFGQGRGVEQDLVEALKWVLLAKRGSALDRFAANDTQSRLEALMTEDQVNLARVRVALFVAEHEKRLTPKANLGKESKMVAPSATNVRVRPDNRESDTLGKSPQQGDKARAEYSEAQLVKKKNVIIIRNSALFAAAGAVGCSIGTGAPILIVFIIFFPMFLVAYLLGFPWVKKK